MANIESWDDELDFDGPAFSGSSHQPSISSRLSIRSDSNAGEDEWNVPLTPNDETSTSQAILSAKSVGIPIPANVPASALLGGTIKRLGKKTSRQTMKNDDWNDDMDFGDLDDGTLTLKPKPAMPALAAEEDDEFSDWAEGSLGIRDAGARRDTTGSTASHVMSPSFASTAHDSEDDGMDGLVFPVGNLSLELKKRNENDDTFKRLDAPTTRPAPITPIDDHNFDEDFLDFGGVNTSLDLRARTLNRNVKPSWKPPPPRDAPAKSQTTLTFSDRGAGTRIPRPIPSRTSRLDTVMESSTPGVHKLQRPEPFSTAVHPSAPSSTTSGPQLLRSKRSMPALRSQPSATLRPPPMPTNKLHSDLQNARAGQHVNRRESGQGRAQSPILRTHSRLSHGHTFVPETPTRLARRDVAPPSLTREAIAKRNITKPARRKNFGDGTELDTFDDLPTSAVKESKFMKVPTMRGPPKVLRSQPSQSKLREKMTTPLPPSLPRSPTKSVSSLPSWARDTAASRNAREQKLNTIKPSREAVQPRTNWAAQVAARTPHSSPTAKRSGRRGPTLITPMGKDNIRHFQDDAVKKGMHWNPVLTRWEGNDSALSIFETTPPPSPPRPALITNIKSSQGVQVVGGMVFDPQRMCWLKLGANHAGNDALSVSLDDDDDPFRDIEDLQDKKPAESGASTAGRGLVGNEWLVGEEFDLGPEFIRRQKEEEVVWRQRTGAWFVGGRLLEEGDAYKWAIREIAGTVAV